jgi:hypothetical protein
MKKSPSIKIASHGNVVDSAEIVHGRNQFQVIEVFSKSTGIGIGLINPQLFRYFLWFVPVCIFAIGMSIRRHVAHPEQLALDKKSIYYRYWNKEKGWVTDDMPLNSTCNISVKSNPMHFRSAGDIVIEGKNQSFRFGWWLPKKTKLRIEILLFSLIANDVIDS